MINFYFNFELK